MNAPQNKLRHNETMKRVMTYSLSSLFLILVMCGVLASATSVIDRKQWDIAATSIDEAFHGDYVAVQDRDGLSEVSGNDVPIELEDRGYGEEPFLFDVSAIERDFSLSFDNADRLREHVRWQLSRL